MRKRAIAVCVLLSLLPMSTAAAHSQEEIIEFEQDWLQRVIENDGVSVELMAERAEFRERHLSYYLPEPEPTQQAWTPERTTWTGSVEQWRPLVAGHFAPDEVETAMCLIRYESHGDPNAKNSRSSASGLFQLLRFWWDETFGLDPFVPEYNVYMAKQIKEIQGWSAWNPYKRGLCR